MRNIFKPHLTGSRKAMLDPDNFAIMPTLVPSCLFLCVISYKLCPHSAYRAPKWCFTHAPLLLALSAAISVACLDCSETKSEDVQRNWAKKMYWKIDFFSTLCTKKIFLLNTFTCLYHPEQLGWKNHGVVREGNQYAPETLESCHWWHPYHSSVWDPFWVALFLHCLLWSCITLAWC